MAKSKTSGVIKLVKWRGSFLQLATAKSFKPGQEARYEATFLADPTDALHVAQIAELKKAAKDLIVAQWGTKPDGLELCFGMADDHPKKAKYDGYKGQFYIVTANTNKPTVVGRNKIDGVFIEQTPGKPEWPVSGYNVNTNVTLWCQDNSFGKAIRANLRIVQFHSKNTTFGAGGADANEEFEGLGDAPNGAGGVASVDDFDI